MHAEFNTLLVHNHSTCHVINTFKYNERVFSISHYLAELCKEILINYTLTQLYLDTLPLQGIIIYAQSSTF